MLPRPTSTSNYAGLASPVTPMWAAGQEQRAARRLLPSAIEISTPPHTIGRRASKFTKKRKAPHDEVITAPDLPQESSVRSNLASTHSPAHPGALFSQSSLASSSVKSETVDKNYIYSPSVVCTPDRMRADQARVDQARVDQARVDQARADQARADRYGPLNPQSSRMPLQSSPSHEMLSSREFVPPGVAEMYKYPHSPSGHPVAPPNLAYSLNAYPTLHPPPPTYAVALPNAKLSRDGILSSPGHPMTVPHLSPSYRGPPPPPMGPETAYMPPSRPSLDDFTPAGLAQPPLHRRSTNYASFPEPAGSSLAGYSLSPPMASMGGLPQPGNFPPLRSMSGPSVMSPAFAPSNAALPNPTFQRSMPPKRAKVVLPSHTYMDYLVSRNPGLALAAAAKNQSDSGARDPYEEYNHYIMRHAADTKTTVIWHPEVEAVFMEALWMIPGEPTKIVMNSRGRGRNELISDYVKHFMGEFRSRKQVSSHLQVLKKLLQHDEVFLDLVGPRRPGVNDEDSATMKSKQILEAATIEELVVKLKDRKQGEPKPQFLLQAERNREISRKAALLTGSSSASHKSEGIASPHSSPLSSSSTAIAAESELSQYPAEYARGSLASLTSAGNASVSGSVRGHRPSLSADTESVTSGSSSPAQEMRAEVKPEPVSTVMGGGVRYSPSATNLNLPMPGDGQPLNVSIDVDYRPLLQPRPVMVDHKVEPLIAPSASVPPVEPIQPAFHGSPRRTRHRRTTSASVELSGDRVLPISFHMGRQLRNRDHVYSRLLRAAYDSPMRPLELSSLLPEFQDLESLYKQNMLGGVPVIHANIAIFIGENKPGPYLSDVQYLVSGANVHGGYRYYSKMVITSRKELLRCQFSCPFQQIAGRGLEEDKDILNAPFLPDFWDDFLSRLEVSGQEYARASLAALKLFQAFYRVSNGREELAFVALSRFSVADDEFSARTRFRRVRGVSPDASAVAARNASSSAIIKPAEVASNSTKSPSSDEEALPEPATPTPVRRHSEIKSVAAPEYHPPEESAGSPELPEPVKETSESVESAVGASAPLPPASNVPYSTGRHRRTDSAMFAQLLGTPTPYQRTSTDSRANSVVANEGAVNTAGGPNTDTPRLGTSASLLGVDTPNLAMLGNTFSFDSPSVFASPRRFNLDGFDLGASPFTTVLSNQDSRPRSSQLDIQRPMTAFEPQAWEEMHDWIYQ